MEPVIVLTACASCFCCCLAAKSRSRCITQVDADTVQLLLVSVDSVGEARAVPSWPQVILMTLEPNGVGVSGTSIDGGTCTVVPDSGRRSVVDKPPSEYLPGRSSPRGVVTTVRDGVEPPTRRTEGLPAVARPSVGRFLEPCLLTTTTREPVGETPGRGVPELVARICGPGSWHAVPAVGGMAAEPLREPWDPLTMKRSTADAAGNVTCGGSVGIPICGIVVGGCGS
mmetsp:Transcript_1031/g.2661  ORF Transcript_1031/g.2661 Transcript_1031/m.2661 type:complete len:227 (-) Transcript_1031:1276-1956(-)